MGFWGRADLGFADWWETGWEVHCADRSAISDPQVACATLRNYRCITPVVFLCQMRETFPDLRTFMFITVFVEGVYGAV